MALHTADTSKPGSLGRRVSQLSVPHLTPREPPYGANFATAVATKLAEAKNGPETANQLWQLVYDQGPPLRVA